MTLGRTVLASGVFDILHPGHVKYLNSAKRLAGKDGRLVVVIARDDTVIRTKGKFPVFNERERAFIVSSLKPVDEVVLGHVRPDIGEAFIRTISKVKPDIVALGYDQGKGKWAEVIRRVVRYTGKEVRLVRIRKFSSGGAAPPSSSRIKRRIARWEWDDLNRKRK